MRLVRSLLVPLLLLAACSRAKGGADAGTEPPPSAAAQPAAPSRHDAGAGRLDLDAYLTFQRARLDAQTKKLPAAVARAAGLSASGLSEPELRLLDRVVTDVLAALTQAQSHPAVAAIPTLEKQLPNATAEEKAALEASLAEARRLEAELTVQALVPVRQKHGDDKVEQVLARQEDLSQVMYFKANALVPLRE